MCGIVGWIKDNVEYCRSALVKAMADRIVHRGPDDEGFFFASGIALGHRRLSIIDIAKGHQPMVTEDGRFVIVYNGEAYNFMDLRHKLECFGETFSSNCDTEVILKGFRHWGPDVFGKLQGMFALAIWDTHKKTLHLARDHFGIKPLYYTLLNDEFIFASEIKALFCHPEVRRQMDPLVLATFLSFSNTFGDNSFWIGIKRCQPGERLEWHDGQLRRFRYFDIGTLEIEPFEGSFEEASEQYRELISNSVKEHLIADVPVGAYLSGGFDSTSVASLAAKEHQYPMSGFTGFFEGYENNWYDERPGAIAVAKKNGISHFQCPISWDDFHRGFEEVAYHMDEPTLGSGAIPQFVVAKKVRERVKVVLTGHGGDELFAGYPVFKAALIRKCGFNRSTFQCLCSGSMDEWIRIIYFLIGGLFDPMIARGQFRMYSLSSLSRIATSSLMDLIYRTGGMDELLARYQPFESRPDIDGITRWYIATYLPTLLIQEDKMSMAHGLEARVPICYEPIVKLSLSLQENIKIHKGQLKAIPRFAMQSVLPLSLYSLPKRGFPTPIIDWLSGPMGYEWENQWKMPLPSSLDGFLNPEGVCQEFLKFRKWGCKMPNAYALAHRLVSLQTLLNCARTLQTIPPIKDFILTEDQKKILPGFSLL